MGLPLWDAPRDAARAAFRYVGGRLITAIVTLFLSAMAAALLFSAGLVGLSRAVGFPVAATLFAVVLVALALAVHLVGQYRARRRAERIATAKQRVEAEMALAIMLARSARPFWPVAAFLVAFMLARRR